MTGNSKASFVCNQVLRVIKESNLNYLVNETPYSAFITLRKKFVKDRVVNEVSEVTTTVDDLALSDVVLRQENIALRQKFKDLEGDKGQLMMTIDELELKVKALEKNVVVLESEKASLSIRLEIAKGQISNQNDELQKQVNDAKEIKEEKVTIDIRLKETEAKVKKIESSLKEKDDDLLILEHTLKNRDSEIERLKNEMDVIRIKNLISCKECTYSSESEADLKCHVNKEHEHHCDHCKYSYIGEEKFRNHICKILVNNPLSEQFGLYTKDWFERRKCIRIFDNTTKEEIIVLHSENCVKQKVCPELPSNFSVEKHFKDTHGMIHLTASYYMKSNNIDWMHLLGMKIMLSSR